MRVSRFYLDAPLSEHFEQRASFEISGDRAHYILHVLRLKAGHDIIVFNGLGGEYSGRIVRVERKSLTITLDNFDPRDKVPSTQLTVGLCIIKKDAMDTAIQKLTELGVATIQPLISERVSVAKKQYEGRENHWHNIAVSACEQCGMNRLPAVKAPVPLNDWTNAQRGTRLGAIPNGAPFAKIPLPLSDKQAAISILIGPEGGFSPGELDAIESSGFVGVTLGERILRAETAAISLTTLVMLSR